jgi:hypothetical protein
MLTLILALGLASPSAAQGLFGRRAKPTPPTAPASSRPTGETDSSVKPATGVEVPPEPIPLEELGKAEITLPDGPIEPFLLRKENGPFMIMAHTFRGPEATRYALALATELQSVHRLKSYIFHLKIQPGGSNIRNVQPTAPEYIPNGDVGSPEKNRIWDEAAVLVGDCATIDEAEKLLKVVKKIKPECLGGLPTIWHHRKGQGLYRAHITANPLQAAQRLYPGRDPSVAGSGALPMKSGEAFDPFVAAATFQRTKKPDPLVKRINGGPRSVYNCPGPYTLQVADYAGRTSPNPKDPRFNDSSFFKKSPLATAADDAERLAENIAKCKSLDPAIKPYVYHDRERSIVTLGAFTGPEDPRLLKLRRDIPFIVGEMLERKFIQLPLAPANELMDVPRP